jgi:hypothetical protein
VTKRRKATKGTGKAKAEKFKERLGNQFAEKIAKGSRELGERILRAAGVAGTDSRVCARRRMAATDFLTILRQFDVGLEWGEGRSRILPRHRAAPYTRRKERIARVPVFSSIIFGVVQWAAERLARRGGRYAEGIAEG